MLTLLIDLTTDLTNLFAAHPYLILLLVLTLEEGGVPLPLPGDLLIVLAGAAVAAGQLNPLLAGLCVVIAATIGGGCLYALGRAGGRPVVARYGHVLRLTPALIGRMEQWLAAHPSAVVWSRLAPGLRVVTSFAAGALRLPAPLFVAATALSAALWAALYLTLGALLGPAAADLLQRGGAPLAVVLGLLAVLALGWAWAARSRTQRRLA